MNTKDKIKKVKRKTFCFWCNKEARVKKFKFRYVCISCYKELTNQFK